MTGGFGVVGTSIEYVGGPNDGAHAILTVTGGGLPAVLGDRHGRPLYALTPGARTKSGRARYDWHPEQAAGPRKPYCTCLQAGCPARPRPEPPSA